MCLKTASLPNLVWIACFFIGSLCSCTSDSPNNRAEVNAFNNILQEKLKEVKVLQDSFELDRAIDLLQTLRRDPGFPFASDSLRSNVYHKYGLIFFRKENYDQAILQLDTAILIRSNIKEYGTSQLANSYYIRSQAKIQLKDEGALKDIQQAIGYIEQTGDQKKVAKYYIIMAMALQDRKDFGQAEYYYQKILTESRIEEGSHEMALFYLSRGTFYALQKNVVKRREVLQKALIIFKRKGKKYERNYFATAITLGNIYLNEQKWQEAEAYFIKINEEIKQSKNNYFKIEEACLNSLALANVQMNKPKKARTYYSELLDLSSKMSLSKYNVTKAIAYEGLGDVDLLESTFSVAITHYHKAIQSLFLDFKTTDTYATPAIDKHPVINKVDALRILDLKADAHLQQFNATGQQRDLEEVSNIYQLIDALLTKTRQEFKAASSRFDIVKNSIPIYEKASLVATQLYEQTQDEKYLQQAFHFATKNKAIVLQDGLQNERAKFAGIPTKLLNEENTLKRAHYQLETEIIELEATGKATKALSDKKKRRFEVIRAYEKLIRNLEEDYPKYYDLKYEASKLVDPDAIAATLPEQTAMVEFFVGSRYLFIFAISSKGLKHYALPKPRRLFTRTRRFRQMLQDSDNASTSKEYFDIAYSLYQDLLERPLADLEKEEEIKRLIIIPDNQLLQISFDALVYDSLKTEDENLAWDNTEMPYLLKKYAISYAYSNKLISDSKANRRIKKSLNAFAGFGLEYDDYTLQGVNELSKLEVDTTLSRGMGKLYHSVNEIESVKSIIGTGSLWRNKKATKQSFLKYAPKSKVLHLAMHGYESADNPLSSALIFTREKGQSDFLLKAADLYTMSLPAEMAVLSACHTASGRVYKGEGVRSLARAFRYAGCPSLVATLWSVSDYSTKEIMVDFYEHLKDGASKDVALQKAKLNYLRTGQPSQKMPYFWTNLVLIGDTETLDF